MSAQADKLLDVAKSQLGVKEEPLGSNKVKFNSEQGLAPGAWCAAFVRWCFWKSGLLELWTAPIEWEGVKSVYCPYIVSSAKRAKQWVTKDYVPGDVVFFGDSSKGTVAHVELVESFDGKTLTTIGGNVGDMVKRCSRPLTNVIGAFRPNFTKEDEMTQEQFERMYKTMVDKNTGSAHSSWADGAVAKAISGGVFQGDGSDKPNFAWQAPLTREAFAVVLDRLGLLK